MTALPALTIAVAVVAWTVTHEELFREPREFCTKRANGDCHWWQRKFFYLFTCAFCFSHYVAIGTVWLTGYRLLYPGWRGFVLAVFVLVGLANVLISAYRLLRLTIKLVDGRAKREHRTGPVNY